MNQQTYYVSTPDGGQDGPHSFETILARYQANDFTSKTLIWTEGWSQWQPLQTFMDSCSASEESQPPIPTYPQGSTFKGYTFKSAIKSCWNNYANFSGRATRSEYWFFQLFYMLVFFILSAIPMAYLIISLVSAEAAKTTQSVELDNLPANFFIILALLFIPILGFSLTFLIPIWAVQFRRLQDMGQPGWIALLNLIPYLNFITSIVLIVLCCQDSQRGTNKYGPSEKYPK